MQVSNTLALNSANSNTGAWINSSAWNPAASSVQVLGLEAGGSIQIYQSNDGSPTTYQPSPLPGDPSAYLAGTITANGLKALGLPIAAWTQFVKVPGGAPSPTTVRVVSQLIR